MIALRGTIEGTRLALESLGVGSTQFGSPRVGNLMAHLRSNITVRIKRTALGLGAPVDLETVALIARGSFSGRRFHHQITAADVATPNPEAAMWNMVPDIDVVGSLLTNQDPNWVTITFRGIGEMEEQRLVDNIDPDRSWIDLSNETDQWGMRRAYVNLVATTGDRQLWAAMDQSAFDLALAVAGDPANIQYWNAPGNQWQSMRPQPRRERARVLAGPDRHHASRGGNPVYGGSGRIDHRYDWQISRQEECLRRRPGAITHLLVRPTLR